MIQYSLNSEKLYDNLVNCSNEVSKAILYLSKSLENQGNAFLEILELTTLIKDNNTTNLLGLLSSMNMDLSYNLKNIYQQNNVLKNAFFYIKSDMESLSKFAIKVDAQIKCYEELRANLLNWKINHFNLKDINNWELGKCNFSPNELISNKRLSFLNMNKKVKL